MRKKEENVSTFGNILVWTFGQIHRAPSPPKKTALLSYGYVYDNTLIINTINETMIIKKCKIII